MTTPLGSRDDEQDDQNEAGFLIQDPIGQIQMEDVDSILDFDPEFGPDQLRGQCSVRLKNGLEISGEFRKRKRHGPGLLAGQILEQSQGIQCIWGNYKNGILQGPGKAKIHPKSHKKDVLGQGVVLEGNFVSGSLEGLVRGLSFKDGSLVWIGRFKKGRPKGPCWMAVQGDSWLYGTLDDQGDFSGDQNCFVYPDLSTVLIGKFEKNQMIEAYQSRIIGVKITQDFLELSLENVDKTKQPVFRNWPSTLTSIRCPWKLRDPYEDQFVMSTKSGLNEDADAGDGLYLRRDVKAGTTVAFYNGIRIKPGEQPPFESADYQIYIDWSENKVTSLIRLKVCPK